MARHRPIEALSRTKGGEHACAAGGARGEDAAPPFLYIGHGVASALKSMECLVCFKRDLAPGERTAIERDLPPPFEGGLVWTKRTLRFSSDDLLPARVIRAYTVRKNVTMDVPWKSRGERGLPSAKAWADFNADIDRWAEQIHSHHPIAFLVKPSDVECPSELDEWHDWSMRRIHSDVLPHLSDAEVTAGWTKFLVGWWKEFLGGLELDEQQRILGGLAGKAKEILERQGGVPKPKRRPDPPPTIEEALAVWEQVCRIRDGGELGMRFRETLNRKTGAASMRDGEYYDLCRFTRDLPDRGREGILTRIAEELLRQPPPANTKELESIGMYLQEGPGDVLETIASRLSRQKPPVESPETWKSFLAISLVRRKRLKKAEPLVGELAFERGCQFAWYAIVAYLKARGDIPSAAAVYHRHRSHEPYLYDGPVPKEFRPKPRDLATKYGETFDSLIAPIWNPGKLPACWLRVVTGFAHEARTVPALASKIFEAKTELERRGESLE